MAHRDPSEEIESKRLPYHRLWQPTTAKWLIVLFGLAMIYAVVRYHIASGVAWNHFPLFILNKTVALAGTAMVACSYLIGKLIRRYDRDPHKKLVVIKFCSLIGFSLASVHGIASLCLITPAYFAKYFTEDGRLNLCGSAGDIM